MLDHVSLKVADFLRSRAFYDQALKPLGLALVMGDGTSGGYGAAAKPYFWIGKGEQSGGADRAAVDAFYRTALAANADHISNV